MGQAQMPALLLLFQQATSYPAIRIHKAQMTILVISVDLDCCRCRNKITKVLDCLEDEFCIEKVEFDEKLNKVIVRGKFCGEKLRRKIWCKAGKIVKEINIVDVWPPPPPPKPEPPKEEPKPEKPKEEPKPEPPKEEAKPDKPKEEPKPEPPKEEPKPPKEEPKPPPPKPKPEVKWVPYPYPLPYPWSSSQGWPWCPCPPQHPCQCTPPPPPPCPPRLTHCSCSKDDDKHDRCSACGGKRPDPPAKPPCSCGGTPPWPPCSCGPNKPQYWWPPPPPPGVCPPPWCNIITEDNPGCSIM